MLIDILQILGGFIVGAIAGFFIGATLDEIMGGAILFSMIAGIACIVYSIENREE